MREEIIIEKVSKDSKLRRNFRELSKKFMLNINKKISWLKI
jgi:hypothetical protein